MGANGDISKILKDEKTESRKSNDKYLNRDPK